MIVLFTSFWVILILYVSPVDEVLPPILLRQDIGDPNELWPLRSAQKSDETAPFELNIWMVTILLIFNLIHGPSRGINTTIYDPRLRMVPESQCTMTALITFSSSYRAQRSFNFSLPMTIGEHYIQQHIHIAVMLVYHHLIELHYQSLWNRDSYCIYR